MPKIQYQEISMTPKKKIIVDQAEAIINEYIRQGYALTLRQLYYQFVARDLLPASWADKQTGSTNNQKSYMKLGKIINDARLGGYIDWFALEDRTRELLKNPHWDSPIDIVNACAEQFQIDKWESQPYRIEVWVEKDALEGVVGKAARQLDISYFSCRGYTSQTAMWQAGMRFKEYSRSGQQILLLHFGDHDPSGIDMSRDIEERLCLFMGEEQDSLTFKRVALNQDQIDQYNPPPNPAKVTDSRFQKYLEQYGEESWELDALDPRVIHDLIIKNVNEYRLDDLFNQAKQDEGVHKDLLRFVANNWRDKIIPLYE